MNRREAIRAAAMAGAGLAAGVNPLKASPREREISAHPFAGVRAHGAQEAEILIRGGRVVNHDGSVLSDVRIRGDRIVEIGRGLVPGERARMFEAEGHLVIPGGIDPHAHMQGNFVDDLTSGTAAAVAGGITAVGTFAYADPGENAIQAMDRWLGEAARSAIGDVFFHASSWPPTPEFADMMPDLAARGQPSHKIFMTRGDFAERRPEVIQVLEAARDAGVRTVVHCEDGAILAAALRRLQASGRTSLAHFAESRPILAEVAATQDAVALLELTGAPMHFVHLSCERALEAARTPYTRGLPLTIETRPLYLYFTEEWLRGPEGPLFIGQPPLRPASDVEAMWDGLRDGRIEMLATDHAPWTRAQKMDPELNVARLRPGVSDLRWVRPVLFSEGVNKGRLSAERFVEVTSTAAARAFGLYPERGLVREGAIADVVILDPELVRTADAADDPSNSDYTPFQGWAIKGWPIVTIRRGQVVFENWQVTAAPGSGRAAARVPWSG